MTVERIRFSPGLSDEVRSAVEPHLRRWAFLIPAWCHEVNVCWQDDDHNGAAKIVVHTEYRRADLTILPNFLTCPERRERNIVHELLHIVTEPMHNTGRDLRDSLVKAHPEMETWADEMLRHSSEAVTCDLVAMLYDHRADPA